MKLKGGASSKEILSEKANRIPVKIEERKDRTQSRQNNAAKVLSGQAAASMLLFLFPSPCCYFCLLSVSELLFVSSEMPCSAQCDPLRPFGPTNRLRPCPFILAYTHTHTHRHTNRERERERERETDRQTDRQTDTHTHTHTERERERERETERKRDSVLLRFWPARLSCSTHRVRQPSFSSLSFPFFSGAQRCVGKEE